MALIKRESHQRESRPVEPLDVFSRFDKMFDELGRSWPFRNAMEALMPFGAEDLIRVDEYRDGETLVIRAELPGIDPDRDVELTVSDGTLQISAQRRAEESDEGKGYLRRELRYGAFNRTLPLPDGVTDSDVSASYADGILEVRITVPQVTEATKPKQIPISRR